MSKSRSKRQSGYRGTTWAIAAVVAIVAAFLFLEDEAKAPPVRVATAPASAAPIPAYHENADEARPFPALQDPSRYGIPVAAEAYRIAHDIPEVLAQQPCYCNCDQSFGHRSLLDCFATDHGATWTVCIKEVFLARQMTEAGRRPSEIREAIVAGAWQDVSLED